MASSRSRNNEPQTLPLSVPGAGAGSGAGAGVGHGQGQRHDAADTTASHEPLRSSIRQTSSGSKARRNCGRRWLFGRSSLADNNPVFVSILLTTLALTMILVIIDLLPEHTPPDSVCLECCKDETPCVVDAPDDFESTYKIMNVSTVFVLTSATVSHTCGCSTIRGDRISSLGQLDVHTLFALLFLKAGISIDDIPRSDPDNVLDESPSSFWCSVSDDYRISEHGYGSDIALPQHITFSPIQHPGQDLRDLAGVQVRVSSQNKCAARNVQIQTGTGISAIQVAWTNVTGIVSLCCSDAWQYIPFNTTRSVPPDGYGTFVRLTVYSSFGNPNKASVNGFRLISWR